jgi:hypothetical protein
VSAKRKARTSFFEKKEAKKLLLPFGRGGTVSVPPRPKGSKSFLRAFFQKSAAYLLQAA